MSEPVNPSMLEFLRWLSSRPRTYAEAMEAWRTSCPRLSVWEDALLDELVLLESTSDDARVTLTPRGAALVKQSERPHTESR
jgi:hypothetical protein